MAESDIIRKIRDTYPLQNKKRRQISDYLLQNLSECCFLPLRKLAEEIGITEVTMLSYCRSLGYQSFTDFREALRNYVVFWKHVNERTWEGIGGAGTVANLATSVIESEKNNLASILTSNSEDDFDKAATMIINAERIFIAAHGASTVSAAYCEKRLTSIGKDATALELSDHHLVSSYLSQPEPSSALLVAIAIAPPGKSTVQTAKLCHSRNFPVLAITDNKDSELASYADCTIAAPASIQGATNSVLPSISIIDVISIITSIKARKTSPGEEERYRSMLEFFTSDN